LNGNKIMLDGVLLALEAQANLVSVGQLSNQYDVNVKMDDEGVVIKKRRDGVQVGGRKNAREPSLRAAIFPARRSICSPRHTPPQDLR
jgi:hypothetical protein